MIRRMEDERRRAKRHCLWFPMTVGGDGETRGRAVSQDISESGMLVAAATKLEEEAPVSVTFRLSPQGEQRTVTGRIVRLRANERDPDGFWPHLAAIEFDEPVPQLEALLVELEEISPASRL